MYRASSTAAANASSAVQPVASDANCIAPILSPSVAGRLHRPILKITRPGLFDELHGDAHGREQFGDTPFLLGVAHLAIVLVSGPRGDPVIQLDRGLHESAGEASRIIRDADLLGHFLPEHFLVRLPEELLADKSQAAVARAVE